LPAGKEYCHACGRVSPRLKPGLRERSHGRARPHHAGLFSHKGFFADDGERVTIVEFEHEEGLRTRRRNPEHITAQKVTRNKYYTKYHVQVRTLDRDSRFTAGEESRTTRYQTKL
jgi:heme-degrading monooxygenase HmoA